MTTTDQHTEFTLAAEEDECVGCGASPAPCDMPEGPGCAACWAVQS